MVGRMSLTPDQDRNAIEVKRATAQKGVKFISLRLININMRRIQGAMCLHATPYFDESNIKQYKFETRGKPLEFIDDEMRGGMYCQMLDCEHNRKFLASMLGYRFWDIDDVEVLADIESRAAEITRNAVIVKPNQPKETKMSDTEIDTEMARLQAEQAKRKVAKADGGKRKPAPTPVTAAEQVAQDFPEEDTSVPTNPTEVGQDTPGTTSTQTKPPEEPRVTNKSIKRRKSSLASIGG